MKRSLLGLLFSSVAICSLLMLATCNKKDNPVDDGDTAEPVGKLLEGNASDSSIVALQNYGPFVVPSNEVFDNFFTTRLSAIIDPGSTIGEVNGILTGLGLKISCMVPGLPHVELVSSPVPTPDSMRSICDSLERSGIFLFAYPSFETAVDVSFDIPGPRAAGSISHLEANRMTAAWNARQLALNNHVPVPVIVPDHYVSTTRHPEMPSQTFLPSGSVTLTLDAFGDANGNHGFGTSGTIAANFDDIGSTGIHPGPPALVPIHSFLTSGYGSKLALFSALAGSVPPSGKFIISTSLGSLPPFDNSNRVERIYDALVFRQLFAQYQNRLLYFNSAGNNGISSDDSVNATYNFPSILASRFDHPNELIAGKGVSPVDSA